MKRFVFVLLALLLTACGGSNAVPATETPLVLPSPTVTESVPTPTEDLRLQEALDAIATQQAGSDQLSAQLTAIAEMPTPTPIVVVVAPTATPLSADDCPHWGYIINSADIYQLKADKNGDIKVNDEGNPFQQRVKELGRIYKDSPLCIYGIKQFDGHRMWKLYFARVDSEGILRGAYADWKWCCFVPGWAWVDSATYWEMQNEE